MADAKHTPGPWVARSYHNRGFAVRWVARRDLNSRDVEYLVNDKGRRKRFHSEAACLAAIAKATGSAT